MHRQHSFSLQLIADKQKYIDRFNMKNVAFVAKGVQTILRSVKENYDHGLRSHECQVAVARVAKSFLTV